MTTHFGPIVATKGSLAAIQCAHCGFIHLDPIPDTSLYAEGRYHRDVKPDYRKEYDEDAEWWNAVYGDWLIPAWRNLCLHIGDVPLLLDIGSGTGHFVYCANGSGWKAWGLEPDEGMAKSSLSFAFCGTYDSMPDDLGRYFVISAHWVMEHLPDPKHFLQWARDRLTDNGLLLITIPTTSPLSNSE